MERGICKIVFVRTDLRVRRGKGVGKFSVSSFKVFSRRG
jgi:hypothetical protein